MPKHEFFPILFQNFYIYMFIWVSVFSILSLIILRFTRSVVDPLFFYYSFNYSFAICAVIFLYYLGYIASELMVYFISAQVLFVFGFLCFRLIFSKKRKYLANDEGFLVFSYYVMSLALLAFTILTYSYFGIPVLESSRWELYNEIPGAGVIGRTIKVAEFFIIFWLTIKILSYDLRLGIFDRFMAVVLIVTAILSGSKMTILSYLFMAYASYLFASNVRPLKKMKLNGPIIAAIGLSVLLALSVSYLHQVYINNVSLNPVFLIAGRLVMSGDLQIMSYPGNVLASLSSNSGFFDIFFHDLKGFVRILGIDDESKSLGLQVMHYHYPHLEDLNMGPASTFETFYYFHFGVWWGGVLCLVSGLILGFSYFRRNYLKSYKEALVGCYFFLSSITIILNPQIAIGSFIFFVAAFISMYVLYCFLLAISVKSVCER